MRRGPRLAVGGPAAPDATPAPAAVSLPASTWAAILEHCRRGLPNEACGIIAGDAGWSRGGRALRWLPARNALASPYRFALDEDVLVRLTLRIDDAGEAIWAVVHSHVASPAVPSPTDLRDWRYEDALQLIVSMASSPVLRAWRLVDGRPSELPVIQH